MGMERRNKFKWWHHKNVQSRSIADRKMNPGLGWRVSVEITICNWNSDIRIWVIWLNWLNRQECCSRGFWENVSDSQNSEKMSMRTPCEFWKLRVLQACRRSSYRSDDCMPGQKPRKAKKAIYVKRQQQRARTINGWGKNLFERVMRIASAWGKKQFISISSMCPARRAFLFDLVSWCLAKRA